MNEKIYYNEDFPEGVEPLYNGNIADDYYSAHDSAHFRLSYDGLNRLFLYGMEIFLNIWEMFLTKKRKSHMSPNHLI